MTIENTKLTDTIIESLTAAETTGYNYAVRGLGGSVLYANLNDAQNDVDNIDDPELDREIYTIATLPQIAAAVLGRKGGKSGTGDSKRRGGSEHYKYVRAKREQTKIFSGEFPGLAALLKYLTGAAVVLEDDNRACELPTRGNSPWAPSCNPTGVWSWDEDTQRVIIGESVADFEIVSYDQALEIYGK